MKKLEEKKGRRKNRHHRGPDQSAMRGDDASRMESRAGRSQIGRYGGDDRSALGDNTSALGGASRGGNRSRHRKKEHRGRNSVQGMPEGSSVED